MKVKSVLAALLLLWAGLQTALAQKVVLHLSNNQIVEYSVEHVDSIKFIDAGSSGGGETTDPSVTGDASGVTSKSATLVGYANSIRDNLASDLRIGFIYCLEGTPNKNNGTQVTVSKSNVAADGSYSKTITGLLADTTYYFRSFVYQSGLWFYGKVKSFKTEPAETILANFTTGEATAITCFSAKVSGSVDVQSSYYSLQYGICYGTSLEPTTADNTMTASSGSFTLQLRKLLGGTVYYYRPYAIVDGRTLYGSVRTFRTLDDNVVETGDIDEETLRVTSRLTIGGGAYSSLKLGVCYGKSEQPTVNDKTVTSDELDDENCYTVTLLKPGVGTIYYRAYLLIDGVPHYGKVKSWEREAVCEYVDLGLPSGTLWATCNVGADSPEVYGDYFAWGETQPKTNYSWSTYKYCNGSSGTMTKYCTDSYYGWVDNKTELEAMDDAATVNWGSEWQMPSIEQLEELTNSNYTTTTWTKLNGVYGRMVVSKKNGNRLFLPAAGFRCDTDLGGVGSFGGCWSRSLYTSNSSAGRDLYFDSSYVTTNYKYDSYRYYGQSVRPVRVKK